MSEEKTGKKIADNAAKQEKQPTAAFFTAVKNNSAEAADNVVYIGPNSARDGLKQNTIYRSRPNDLIAAVEQKYKNISRLFVPVDRLDKAITAITRTGTPINLAYNEVMGAKR